MGTGTQVMEKQPAPTGRLAWIGFGWCVFSLACLAIAFCSPYWWQTWPKSENEFRNIGLWHVCFHNYMHFKDDSQEVYNGCWWLFDTQPKYYKLREWIIPPWFITCQVLTTGCLLVLIATTIISALIFLHMCPIMNHEYLQTYGMFASGSMMFLVTMIILVVGILFGSQVNDRYWLPRPDLNLLSWGFGFLISSGISALISGVCFFKVAWDTYNELLHREDVYTKQAMELSAFQMEGVPPEDEFAVVQPGYSGAQQFPEEEPYPMRPPSYHQASLYAPPAPPPTGDEPSFERKPGYEEPPYERRAGYEPEPAQPLMYDDQPQDYGGEYARAQEPREFGQSFEQPSAYGKSYDRNYDRHYSDTSFNDPEQEMLQTRPERQY